MPITTEYSIDYDTYDILPKGANADLISSVVISGLKSPTNTWKWSEIKAFGNEILKKSGTKPFSGNTKGRKKPIWAGNAAKDNFRTLPQ